MFIKLLLKLVFICFFTLNLHAHDPKNCDVLQNYDFSGFESWKIEVVNRSSEYGLDEDFVSKLIAPYEVNKRVIENDKCQPEFTLTFSEYIEKRNSETRIQNGLNNKSKYNDLLNKIDNYYNVQSRFILSIWGLETAYGKITGNYPVLESLLTMSYDERRRRYFTKELYNALKILEQGHINVIDFKGSWAGAMGQNQFMPSSFLNYAQDFNNDGKKDIWTDTEDSLASIARYLQGVGSNKWDPNYTWGREVIPPENVKSLEPKLFVKREKGCLAVKKLSKKLPLNEFRLMNFKKMNGNSLDNLDINSYLLRMGREEGDYRYFIVYDNYLNILSYNCSNYYGLSVGLLSDKFK